MKRIFTLAVAAILLVSCRININNHVALNNTINFEILKQEAYGGRDSESTVVITSAAQLATVYKELGWSDVPSVDFEKNNVVALFMGEKRSGGYSIGVKGMVVTEDTVTLKVYKNEPDGMATMAITNPYCIVLIPKKENVVVE